MNVGIGALEIKMLADVSRLRADMAAAEGIVGKSMAGIASSARLAMSALSGLGVGIGIGGLVSIVRGAVNAMDALNDLKDATGSSIEELARLERIARLNGGSLDTVGAAMIKLNQALASVDGKNTVSLALKELGLDAEKLKKQDLSKSVRDIAVALNGFADSSTKSRYQLELLGKKTGELSAFLKDVVDGTDQAAATTARMAQEAEQFNKNLALLATNAGDTARVLTSDLVEALNQVFSAAKRNNGSLTAGFLEAADISATRGAIRSLELDMQRMGAAVSAARAELAKPFSGGLFDAVNRALAQKTVDDFEAMTAAAAGYRAALDKLLPQGRRPANEGGGRLAGNTLRDLKDLEEAQKRAEEAGRAAARTADEQRKAYERLIGSIRGKTAEMADEVRLGAELSPMLKMQLETYRDIAAGVLVLTPAQKRLVGQLFEEARAVEKTNDARKEQIKALAEIEKVRAESIKVGDQTLKGLDQEVQSMRDKYVEITAGNVVLEAQIALRLEDAAAMHEQMAATLAFVGENEALIRQQSLMAERLREQIALRKGIAQATANKEAEEANAKAAKEAADEWQRTSDQIGQSLVDALMQGGKSAAEYIKGLFRTMVLRPIIQAVVQPLANGLLQIIGMGGGGTAGGAGGLLQGAGTLSSLYGMGSKAYGAVTGWLGYGSAAEMVPMAAYAQGSAGAAAGASGASGAAGSLGATGWGAIVAAAVAAGIQANKDYEAGFTRDSAKESGTALGNASWLTSTVMDKVLGINGKWADILSGATLTAKIFGRGATQTTGGGFEGSFGGGAFTGAGYLDKFQEGGWLRSDKRWTESTELGDELGRFLDTAAKSVLDQATKFGDALGLPAEALAGVTKDIKVSITSNVDETKASIEKSLAGYGEALAATWADALKPVTIYGETAIQTIERVGAAILGVNQVLEQIGVTALAATVDGGKAAVALSDAFGGVANLSQAASGYFDAYFTEAEKSAKATQQVTDALASVGLAMPDSREAFRGIVEGLDLTTESGRQQFVAMMNVADAFATLNPILEDTKKFAENAAAALGKLADDRSSLEAQLLRAGGNEAGARAQERAQFLGALDVTEEQRNAIAAAYDYNEALRDQIAALDRAKAVEQERTGLERQLLEVQGDTAAVRQIERDALDETNRLLYDRITALQDEKAVMAERQGLQRQLLEVQGDTAALLALERETLDDSNKALFDRIQAVKAEKVASEEAKRAADIAAQAMGRMFAAIDANLGKFQTPEQATRSQVERMAGRLGEVGVNVPLEALLGATRQQILDFATAFVVAADNSTDAKTAVIEVAGALADLRKSAEQDAIRGDITKVTQDIADLTAVFGNLAAAPVQTVAQQLADGMSELERLEVGLANVMGTMAVSIQDALASMIESQRALQSFRAGLATAIEDARITGLSPTDRVAALKATEAALFGQLGTAKDPAAVAARLQGVILQRVKEEVALRQAAEDEIAGLSAQSRADQIQTLKDQISGFERLRDLAQDIGQFTGSLRFSDLSPLNPEAQLAAAQRLFDETAAKARGGDEFAQRNLTGNAQALLQEARSFFASSGGFASIFNGVLATLDEIGAGGVAADPQIAALEAQLAELQSLNDGQAAVVASSQAIVAGFTALDEALAAREAANEEAIRRQAELAQKQIDEQRLTNEKLAAQIEQAAKVYIGLIAKLDQLNGNLDTLATNADLAGAQP